MNSSKQTANLPTSFTAEDAECLTNEQAANEFSYFYASIPQDLESIITASDHNPLYYLVRSDFPVYDGDLVTSESEITTIITNLNVVGAGWIKYQQKIC